MPAEFLDGLEHILKHVEARVSPNCQVWFERGGPRVGGGGWLYNGDILQGPWIPFHCCVTDYILCHQCLKITKLYQILFCMC